MTGPLWERLAGWAMLCGTLLKATLRPDRYRVELYIYETED